MPFLTCILSTLTCIRLLIPDGTKISIELPVVVFILGQNPGPDLILGPILYKNKDV